MSLISADPASDQIAALLDWYVAMGVDLALDDEAVDRFATNLAEKAARAERAPAMEDRPPPRQDPRLARPSVPAPPLPRPAQAATIPNGEAVLAARSAAASAPDLDSLRKLLETFDGCNLKLTAKSLVFGDGNPSARLMLIGEAPGRDEDIEGRPFVGRSGKLLDRMLAAAGLERSRDAYIANVVYWRPPGNREPSDQEVAICKPFILRQIELVDPDVIVFLGGQPAKALLGPDAAKSGIRRLRGHWMVLDVGGKTYPALPTFHPAYLLRNPIEKRMAWRDMLAIAASLSGKKQ